MQVLDSKRKLTAEIRRVYGNLYGESWINENDRFLALFESGYLSEMQLFYFLRKKSCPALSDTPVNIDFNDFKNECF